MQSPYSNPYLSMRARGLFAYYAELGRVVSADELSAVMPEGRDAIRSAMTELKQFHYIKATRTQINGQWSTYLKFTDGAKKFLSTDDGFSGVLLVDSSTTTSTSDLTTSPIVELLRSSTIPAPAVQEEGEEMVWNLDEEEPVKAGARKIRDEAEDDSGAVGKVIDKKAMRQAKYGAKVLAGSPTEHRSNKPEDDWATKDLIAEFMMLLDEHAGNTPMQMNTRQMATFINKLVGQGVTRVSILKGIRMFFEDQRNLHDLGIGKPLWSRFIAYYQSVHGITVREEVSAYLDEDDLAHQEKMLRLLGGK